MQPKLTFYFSEINNTQMRVKIDTKEAFYVICIEEQSLTANMSADLASAIEKKQDEAAKSLIINLKNVTQIDMPIAEQLQAMHDHYYRENKSFVVCELHSGLKKQLEDMEILGNLNYTPTESEAWDIVQMEEIERELDKEL